MEHMMLGLQLTIFGIGAVFLALSALAGLLMLMERILSPKKPAVKNEVSVQDTKKEINQQGKSPKNMSVDPELVAVITSAIAVMMEKEKGYVPNLQIKSITPASDLWKMRGRGNLVSSK